MSLLTGINRERGTAVVMVTHNQALFEKYQGRVFVCKDESCTEVLKHVPETGDGNAGNSQETDALNTENGPETDDGSPEDSREEENKQE
ncbi:MAG TPA: hypothetical protein IAC09_07100 [Candidatus Cryptobacteroides intestinipullorum]|nr:hypothetical protein [Candidatus Cryptobacteroides intestinipullorum]